MSPSGEATGFETRGGSADSGQSSSPDSNSSRGSIADSLEEPTTGVVTESNLPEATAAAPTQDEKVSESSATRLDADDVQTIKNYQDAEDANNLSRSKNNISEESSKDTLKTAEPSIQQVGVSGEKLPSPDVAENATEQPLRSALVNNNNNIKSINNNNNNNINNKNCEVPQVNAKAELHDISTTPQETKQTLSTKTTTGNGLGNNYSGLNLNMTASEMRELIARRKKFDPKKAQMNIRQKYEIIQQM